MPSKCCTVLHPSMSRIAPYSDHINIMPAFDLMLLGFPFKHSPGFGCRQKSRADKIMPSYSNIQVTAGRRASMSRDFINQSATI